MPWQHLHQPHAAGTVYNSLSVPQPHKADSLAPSYAPIPRSLCFWDLPGDALAAPASALCGWKVQYYLSLSLGPLMGGEDGM